MGYKGPRKWIFKRDNKTHRFQLKDSSGNYDLTNVTEIKFTVRENDSESASQIFQCTKTGADITVESPATDGKINVIVVPADTTSATAGRKIYDIEVEDSASKKKTFGKGIYEIIQDITQS